MPNAKAIETGLIYPRTGSSKALAARIKKYLRNNGVNIVSNAEEFSVGHGVGAKKASVPRRSPANQNRAGS